MDSAIKIFCIFSLLLFGNSIQGQDTITSPATEQLIENIAEQYNSEDNDLSNLMNELSFLKSHPINLNKTNFEELSSLSFLNELQVANLLDHIKRNGPLISLYELQSVDGFDINLINSILPYVAISNNETQITSFKKTLKQGNHKLLLRNSQIPELQKGYDKTIPTHYLGSSNKIYTRYQYAYSKKLSIGITAEKDPGEEFFKGSQKNGFDFYSAHFFYQPDKLVKSFIVGDYLLNFGQGLALWQGFAFSKSSDVISIKKIETGIRPYLSSDENRFMRGAAVTTKFKKVELTGFISANSIDANTIDSVSASSLQETGLHGTLNEIADRHAIKRSMAGGNLCYKTDKIKFGLTSVHTSLSTKIQPNSQPYNKFNFSGDNVNNTSIDYSYRLKNIVFFGEGALSSYKNSMGDPGFAYLNGIIASLDQKISFSILQRNYTRDYFSFFSNGFSEGSSTSNEKGIYLGMNVRISKTVILNCYYDKYIFPWLKFQRSAPSNGDDHLIQLDYTPSKKTSIYLRYKNESDLKDAAQENYLVKTSKQNLRLNCSYKISKTVSIRSRIELVQYKNESGTTENGNVIIQDLIFTKKKTAFYLRYAMFDTPSYDSRIYSYENDISGVWSSPAYYYKGSRFYTLLKIKAGKHINCWLRYSQSFYTNKSVISPGTLNEINGNSRSEIKAQFDLSF